MKSEVVKISVRGNRHTLLLPDGFSLTENELYVRREGRNIILFPKRKTWKDFFEKVPLPSEDFMKERVNNEPQKREEVF